MNPRPGPDAENGAPAGPAAPATGGAWPARWRDYRRAALGDDLVAALIVTFKIV